MNAIPKNNVDRQYLNLLVDIMGSKGRNKEDRTGTGTRSVFGRQLRFDMKEGFPLLTSKKMYTKGVIVELLWFLGKHMQDEKYKRLGRTNIKYMVDNDCNIWIGDAHKKYVNDTKPGDCTKLDDWTWDGNKQPRHWTKAEFTKNIKEDDEFARRWGDLGPVYGEQWCNWGGDKRVYASAEVMCEGAKTLDEVHSTLIEEGCTVDKKSTNVYTTLSGYNQIQALIHELHRNPDSRRLLVTAWNPLDLEASVLPPCHYGFQCYTTLLSPLERDLWLMKSDKEAWDLMGKRGISCHDHRSKMFMDSLQVPRRRLSLMWNQRSVDVPLGLPFNIASYGFLLHMLADMCNMVPDELICNLGDTHYYLNQVDGMHKQLQNETFALPTLTIKPNPGRWYITDYEIDDFVIEGYKHGGVVNYPLSN